MHFTNDVLIPTILLAILPGVLSKSEYSVTYSSTSICGLKGSFVDIPCTYSYPSDRKVNEAFWHINWHPDTLTDLSLDPRYQGRVEYLGDKVSNCTVRLKDLKESDAEERYRFRFITDDSIGKFSGDEVSLSLTDLHVVMSPEVVKEGDHVTLTCSNTCHLSNDPTYIWYRNSQPLSNVTSNTLSTSFSKDDYSCAVRGQEDYPSSECVLSGGSVTYTPQSICALEGSSVELHSYYTYPCGHTVTKAYWFITWLCFQDLIKIPRYQDRVNYTEGYNNGHTLNIRNLSGCDSNDYRFRFLTHKGGNWSGGNLHLSITVLQVRVHPATATEGDTVTLTCSATCRLSNNPTYIWYWNSQPLNDSHTADNMLVIDSARPEDAGKYSCAVQGHETLSSPEMTLNVRYPPRKTTVLLSLSSDPHKGDSVTLTCSSDANPPVHNYTWYRHTGDETVLQGTGRTLNLTLNFNPNGDGLYLCEVKNEVSSKNSTGVRVLLPGAKRDFSWTPLVIGVILGTLAGLVTGTLIGAALKKGTQAREVTHSRTGTLTDTTTGSQVAQSSPADSTYAGLNLATRSPDYDSLNILKTSAEGIKHKTTQDLPEAQDYENIEVKKEA